MVTATMHYFNEVNNNLTSEKKKTKQEKKNNKTRILLEYPTILILTLIQTLTPNP